jgi:hypothetical protein
MGFAVVETLCVAMCAFFIYMFVSKNVD